MDIIDIGALSHIAMPITIHFATCPLQKDQGHSQKLS
jgi:hypothetical protein